jgi:hypothetical protein
MKEFVRSSLDTNDIKATNKLLYRLRLDPTKLPEYCSLTEAVEKYKDAVIRMMEEAEKS